MSSYITSNKSSTTKSSSNTNDTTTYNHIIQIKQKVLQILPVTITNGLAIADTNAIFDSSSDPMLIPENAGLCLKHATFLNVTVLHGRFTRFLN